MRTMKTVDHTLNQIFVRWSLVLVRDVLQNGYNGSNFLGQLIIYFFELQDNKFPNICSFMTLTISILTEV